MIIINICNTMIIIEITYKLGIIIKILSYYITFTLCILINIKIRYWDNQNHLDWELNSH